MYKPFEVLYSITNTIPVNVKSEKLARKSSRRKVNVVLASGPNGLLLVEL